jgi:hypothetical protein
MIPRVVRHKNKVMNPMGPRSKNGCAGKGQQQFTRPNPIVKNVNMLSDQILLSRIFVFICNCIV